MCHRQVLQEAGKFGQQLGRNLYSGQPPDVFISPETESESQQEHALQHTQDLKTSQRPIGQQQL